jgi:hypothetical protein
MYAHILYLTENTVISHYEDQLVIVCGNNHCSDKHTQHNYTV